jgi:hypothetical protein
MNIVRCISGLRQEGKTTELIETCIDMMSRLSDDEPRFYFVTVEENADSILEKIKSELLELEFSTYQVNKMIKNTIVKVIHVAGTSSVDDLYNVLTEAVTTQDCEVFIDMPELIDKDFASNINRFIDKFPGGDVMNSIDIYWTRSRRKHSITGHSPENTGHSPESGFKHPSVNK